MNNPDLGQYLGWTRTPDVVVLNPKLTRAQRRALPSHEFALPETRELPIDTESRARAALARAKQFYSKSDQERVIKAVHKRYPDIAIETKPSRPTVGLHHINPLSAKEIRRLEDELNSFEERQRSLEDEREEREQRRRDNKLMLDLYFPKKKNPYRVGTTIIAAVVLAGLYALSNLKRQ